MSHSDSPMVQLTENSDGSAEATVSFADDHRFSISPEGAHALVEYEETILYRGDVRTIDPPEPVVKALMTSDEMTHYLDRHGLDSVKRGDKL